jgi:4-hydroxy-3-methylbut-2-enyl diphosphate reductase
MAELTVATPLRVENIAVKRSLPTARVVLTGMGPRRSRTSRARIAGDGPLAVMGVAGGLADDVLPGDLVVADEVREGLTAIATLRPGDLVESLRAMGFRVHVGPIVSVGRVAGNSERVALARTGAVAVDTETAQLIDGWPGRPLAVVRSIVDTADAPLWRVGTSKRGLAALGALRRAAPAVAAWASTVGIPGINPQAPRPAVEGT